MIERNFYMAAVFFMPKYSKEAASGRLCRCQSKQEKLSVTGSLCFRKELKQYA